MVGGTIRFGDKPCCDCECRDCGAVGRCQRIRRTPPRGDGGYQAPSQRGRWANLCRGCIGKAVARMQECEHQIDSTCIQPCCSFGEHSHTATYFCRKCGQNSTRKEDFGS